MSDAIDTFVCQENIKRYRAMLASECDEQRRLAIQTLLAREAETLQRLRAGAHGSASHDA